MPDARRSWAPILGAVCAALLGGCLDSGPSAGEGAAQRYAPDFGASGGVAAIALGGLRAPAALTCRYEGPVERVTCTPTTLDGLDFDASYAFRDRTGRAQPTRDGATNSANERTTVRGRVALPGGLASALDSVESVRDVTRTGIIEAASVLTGSHVVRTTARTVSGRDTVRVETRARTEWRGVRTPRTAPLFRPSFTAPELTPGIDADSVLALARLSGTWAEAGEKFDETTVTRRTRAGDSTVVESTLVRWEGPDRARVTLVAPGRPRARTCVVDRVSFSARCE
jgi:hypothetical protein